ncbi:IS66 family transposase, partial [Deinococcus xinjiangensis]|uniref:IS66 family transposase n=1 Tax=Deinococcus xinjiangensis TaxID=457454 RepID=UPI0033657555
MGALELSHFEKASITELPAGIRGEVTVYNVPVMICPQCGRKVRGEHADLAPGQCGATAHRIGPRLGAVVQAIHHELGVSERKIPRLLEMTVGLSLTQSAINQAAQRLAQDGGRLATEVLALEERLRGAEYVHHDDTGWRMNGQQAWVSAYRSEDVALFKANHRHTSKELNAVLKGDFAGTLICDRFVTYDAEQFAQMSQQKCMSHVIRNISEVIEQVEGRAGRASSYLVKLKTAFQDALTVHRDFVHERCNERQFRIRADRVKRLVSRLLKRTDLRTKESERLRAGLWKQHRKGRLLLFLEKPNLPPTNNAAERQLRSVVLARKVSQCSKNERGATTYMRIKSVTETARLRGHDPVEV